MDEAERSYKYFRVRERVDPAGMKWYRILNKRSWLTLGTIEWYAPWRQFCFFPAKFTETVWSADCLSDVQDAIRWAEERSRKSHARQVAKRGS